ncbi:MAG: methyltransferase [Gammaproteobacteria bacterium]|nr:methyltransferase [Gammaproteobacteria bacterium]
MPDYRDYLSVDNFLRDFLSVQVLKQAFDSGLIAQLEAAVFMPRTSASDRQGEQFLLGILVNSGVIRHDADQFSLTPEFKKALTYRDLLQVKIEFANMLAPDVLQRLHLLLNDETKFMAESTLFELFDYGRAIEPGAENYRFTKRWVNLTTSLTRYESAAVIAETDFTRARNWLDIGGNSGEFALQLARKYPQLSVTVADLPVVCEVGQAHIRPFIQLAHRINFTAVNALEHDLPAKQEVVSFKSMLHDWQEPAIERLLQQAFAALKPGGRLLIFERAPIDFSRELPLYGNLPTLLFFRSYKPQQFYREAIEKAGFKNISCRTLRLEMDFHLIEAVKS